MEAGFKLFENRKILIRIYLMLQILIYISFMTIDITGSSLYLISNSLKFSGIILCFLFTLLLPNRNNERFDNHILRAALFFTVISDLFILILDKYIIGLVTFCIVQSLYLIRLGNWKNQLEATAGYKRMVRNFIRNLMVAVIILTALAVNKIKLEWMIIISCFYFISIFFNVIDAILIAVKANHNHMKLFAAGMVLFLLCDINVGLFNLSDFISISSRGFSLLYNLSAVAMWMFYLPAQVSISFSRQSKGMK